MFDHRDRLYGVSRRSVGARHSAIRVLIMKGNGGSVRSSVPIVVAHCLKLPPINAKAFGRRAGDLIGARHRMRTGHEEDLAYGLPMPNLAPAGTLFCGQKTGFVGIGRTYGLARDMVGFQGMRSTFPEVVDGADLSLPERGSSFNAMSFTEDS